MYKYVKATGGYEVTGNIPKNSYITGVLDAEVEQKLLVNAAGRSRIVIAIYGYMVFRVTNMGVFG